MSWTRKQIITVQIYRRYAEMPDAEYRYLLKSLGGVFSSRAKSLTNHHFDIVMAEMERQADELYNETGKALPRQMQNLQYWRKRCPSAGMVNSRLKHRLMSLWDQLQRELARDERHHAYLMGIASKACNCTIAHISEMRAWQAMLTIEALKDRLKYATRNQIKESA